MKILHILATPRAEGTPNLVLDWLTTQLHEQEVFALEAQPADLTTSLRAAACWYGESYDGLLSGWPQFPRITARIRYICQKRKPDLVICWVAGLAGWICLGARLAGVRMILVHAGNPPTRGFKDDWITRYVYWPLWGLGARVICCSHYVCDELKQIPLTPQRIFHAVHNCSRVESVRKRAEKARSSRYVTDGRLEAIMVATLERHKDHETLFRALPEVLLQYPNFHLKLAGEGSLRSTLEKRVADLAVASAVSFLGSRSDVPELLGQADLFIFSTTEQEGLGSVLLEALAAELPVIASDVPACRELLDDGRQGTLVPRRDPHALAAAILQRLGQITSKQKEETRSSKTYLDQFTPERMMKSYFAIAGSA